MGNCLQSMQKTFEDSRKRREYAQQKNEEEKYAALRKITAEQAEAERERYLAIADKLADLAERKSALENNTSIPQLKRDALIKTIVIEEQAEMEELDTVEKELMVQTRKQICVKKLQSLIQEKKKGKEINKLSTEIKAFDLKDVEKQRDEQADKMEDLEDSLRDKLENSDVSDFSEKVAQEIKESEKRQKKPIPTLKLGYSTPLKTVATALPKRVVTSSSSSSATSKASILPAVAKSRGVYNDRDSLLTS